MWDCHSCDPGSNPGPGVQPSVRIPTSIDFKNNNNNNNKNQHNNFEIDSRLLIQKNNNNNNDNYKDAKLFENNQMRDLYNRKKKLDYWTERIHKDLDEHDKRDILKFLEIMQEKDQSILTIIRCISIVIQIRKQIDKPLSKATKEDIKAIFRWMEPSSFLEYLPGPANPSI
jgi:hypothetical protein